MADPLRKIIRIVGGSVATGIEQELECGHIVKTLNTISPRRVLDAKRRRCPECGSANIMGVIPTKETP